MVIRPLVQKKKKDFVERFSCFYCLIECLERKNFSSSFIGVGDRSDPRFRSHD